MDREKAKSIIESLVERYAEHQRDYHHKDYNESKTRLDFINPFFEALGWDINNRKGDSEAYREVINEDKLQIKGKSKAPDYGFRLAGSGNKRLFYLEAKKPSIPIKVQKEPAYQLRRYGSSAQVPVSILTNFEDFIVYDCTRVPRVDDSATVARLKHINFKDYVAEFDFIYDTFSHEAVTKGRFDKFVQGGAAKRGTDTLDKRFVQSLDEWRKYLATNIAQHNRKLNDEELNYAVQQTLDRLIFLRFCEDRSVEPYAQMQKVVAKGDAYKALLHLFKEADAKYNSGLFDFEKDTITPHLKMDPKVVRNVINEMYYPLCNFEFSVMPVEILGNAYEQFLGKVIRILPSRAVRIEEKPEVRKAGGVYYTPQYIVEYIVKNTVGKLIEGKTPKEIEKIKIVDPACGSGSFLLGAFDYLLRYHTDWYHRNGFTAKKGKENPFTPQGTLSTHEKKRILRSSIYGVDLDANAVEVSKLSLLLKCMEGETEASMNQQMTLYHERVLPNLDDNIKDGNSLIDTDFYDAEIDLGYEKKIKPFSWQKAFPEVFKQGGFDAVIGNPPYVRIQYIKENSSESVIYFKNKFYVAESGNYDLYVLFIEQAIKILRKGGLTGYILPNKFFNTDYGENVRDFLLRDNTLQSIVDFGHHQVFENVATYCCLLFLQNSINKEVLYLKISPDDLLNPTNKPQKIISKTLSSESWGFHNKQETTLIQKLYKESIKLIDLPVQISRGSSSGDDKIFILEVDGKTYKNEFESNIEIEEGILKIPIFASDFGRYYFKGKSNFRIVYPYRLLNGKCELMEEDYLLKQYPKAHKYLHRNRQLLLKRKQTGKWYGYSAARNLLLHSKADIVIPLLANKGLFSTLPVNKNEYTLMASGGFSISLSNTSLDSNYILGLINSRLLFWLLKRSSNLFRDGWITCTKQYFSNLPIKNIEKLNQDICGKICEQVSVIKELKSKLEVTRLPSEMQQIETRINHTDNKIDQLVYELYELTEDEIKIIEESISA